MRLCSYRPRLPPELIEYIIDHLHDSSSTLRACSRVCRAWVAPSHFHLFYCRKIIPGRTNTVPLQIRKLLEFLQGSPHIALYIRVFHFSVGSGSMFRMRHSDWPPLETVLPHLLRMLTQLRKLVLGGVPFTSLMPDTRAAFRALFALPCLVEVQVICLEVAKPEHFSSLLCPPLKRLSASVSLEEDFAFTQEDVCAVDEEVKAVELQKKSPCRLEYLYSDSTVFMRWLLGAQTVIDVSAIRTLDAWCGPEHMEGLMARLIKRLGSSLEDLTIQHPRIDGWGTLFSFSSSSSSFDRRLIQMGRLHKAPLMSNVTQISEDCLFALDSDPNLHHISNIFFHASPPRTYNRSPSWS